MNSLSMGKYRPAVILTLALTVFLASCKGTSDDPVTTPTPPVKGWVVSTFAGTAGTTGNADRAAATAQFSFPAGIAVDSSGNLYVADSGNNCIRKIEWVWRAGWWVTTVAGTGTATASGENPDNAVATAATFNQPTSVAVDSSGNLYVADTGNNLIRKITSEGEVTLFAGSGKRGDKDATGTEAEFNEPSGVAVDSSGNLYVVDYNNNRIRKITPTGVVSTLAGSGEWGYKDATGTAAQFDGPLGIAVDSSGFLYVADWANHCIRKITPEGKVTTLAGSSQGYKEGTGTEAQFNYPVGVAVDSSGNVYVADTNNNRIRKITPGGKVTTIAGDGTTTQFYNPADVAVDSSGNLYVVDRTNNRIRKIEYK